MDFGIMTKEKEVEREEEEEVELSQKKGNIFINIFLRLENKYPKFAELLKDNKVQVLLLFLILLILYLNLIIWNFYFSSDSIGYGLTVKNWFEGKEVDNYNLLRPAHPLTMPLAILFTYPMLPLIDSNYLLSYAILDAILGAGTVALFYWVCKKFTNNTKFSLLCSLGLAFSFAFWENCEMAEDKSLGFLLYTLFLPILFSFVGEINPFSWFTKMKDWQKGFVSGILMGFMLASHVSFVLIFLFVLILGWRYLGLKFFKSSRFIFFVIGSAVVCIIVFGIVALALEVDSLGGFIGMFTQYHTGEGGKQYFALADPGSFSLITQLRGLAGGVFTTFFMFITQAGVYYIIIIGLASIVLLIMAYIVIYARKSKVVSSFYILMAIWFANYFFFAPDDRNAWVYLLVPVWLSVCIGLSTMEKEGLRLILLKRKLPGDIKRAIVPIMAIIVAILFFNNVVVFANAHLNHDEREKFVDFVDENISDDNAIFIVDESMTEFFAYYSEKEAINFAGVALNPQVSSYVNESFNNSRAIYVAEYWLLDSYVLRGGPRAERTYEERLKLHREYVMSFNSMYEYELTYTYDWSDIYIITELNQTG